MGRTCSYVRLKTATKSRAETSAPAGGEFVSYRWRRVSQEFNPPDGTWHVCWVAAAASQVFNGSGGSVLVPEAFCFFVGCFCWRPKEMVFLWDAKYGTEPQIIASLSVSWTEFTIRTWSGLDRRTRHTANLVFGFLIKLIHSFEGKVQFHQQIRWFYHEMANGLWTEITWTQQICCRTRLISCDFWSQAVSSSDTNQFESESESEWGAVVLIGQPVTLDVMWLHYDTEHHWDQFQTQDCWYQSTAPDRSLELMNLELLFFSFIFCIYDIFFTLLL